jgi:uncharacterized coiled-coil protein SlyX
MTTSKPSRWGSFLQQAVADVEARLDTILTDGDDAPGTSNMHRGAAASQVTPPEPSIQVPVGVDKVSRPSSPATGSVHKHDRLQARLARAVAAKSAGPVSPRPATEGDHDTPISTDVRKPVILDSVPSPTNDVNCGLSLMPHRLDRPIALLDKSMRTSSNGDHDGGSATSSSLPTISSPLGCDILADHATTERDDEVKGYVEQIEALQAKLHYLSKELIDASHRALDASAPDSLERRMAERDVKFSSLLTEGQHLAATVQVHRGTIKTLLARERANTILIGQLTESRDMAMAKLSIAQATETRIEELEKMVEDSADTIRTLGEEVSAMRRYVDTKDSTIRSLESEIRSGERCGPGKLSEMDQQRIRSLEEDLAMMEAEKKTLVEQTGVKIGVLESELNKAKDRLQQMERDREWELKSMESKLETARIQAEDVSSWASADSHVTIIRQLETLQSQYATARKNWEGIEASLIAKASNLESERDQALRRESDLRKKARDSVCISSHNAMPVMCIATTVFRTLALFLMIWW